MIAAVILCALLTLAGICVWRWNERKNAEPAEHNSITGTGAHP
ncbi:membrane protein [Gordonia phage Moosehead]|nr:membrane protein [Gordonia phage Moosehead]